MTKEKMVGFRLAPEYINVIDQWSESKGLSRNEAIRLAIKHLKGYRIVRNDFDEYHFEESPIRSRSTNFISKREMKNS
jgi:hypothetical protein